jgi:uncharacterized damage-inducible protein DinB
MDVRAMAEEDSAVIKLGLLMEFDHEIAATRKLLERIPDDRRDWKPHARSRSLGALATHIASLPAWVGTILNEPGFDLDLMPPRLDDQISRDDLLASFDDSSRRARAWIDRTDAEYMAPWTLRRGGHELFTLPRIAALRSFVFGHLIHHRGQMTVYLRLNDIAVPPIYGPSADEG